MFFLFLTTVLSTTWKSALAIGFPCRRQHCREEEEKHTRLRVRQVRRQARRSRGRRAPQRLHCFGSEPYAWRPHRSPPALRGAPALGRWAHPPGFPPGGVADGLRAGNVAGAHTTRGNQAEAPLFPPQGPPEAQ